jgi:hypothetical protein
MARVRAFYVQSAKVFDERASAPQGVRVSESDQNPLLGTLRWLSRHAGFPTSRLAKHAEALVLLAAAAQSLENANTSRPDFTVKSRDVARDAALRAHSERRKLAHFKCDNSAKV